MDYREVQGYGEESPKGVSKSFWIVVFGVIVIGVFLGVYFFISSFAQKSVSENKLIAGASLDVEANNSVKLNIGDEEEHSLIVDFVGLDSVEITIRSDPIKIKLSVNEVKEVDLNGDGIADLRVKLVGIDEGRAKIAVKKIGKDICVENWECGDWSECSSGKQKRVCEDVSSCGTTFDRSERVRECLEVEFVKNDSSFENENRTGNTEGNLIRNETRDRINESSSNNATNNVSTAGVVNNIINSSSGTSNNIGNPGGVVECVEDWSCDEWGECSSSGIQSRNCSDLNECGTVFNRPSLSENCEIDLICDESRMEKSIEEDLKENSYWDGYENISFKETKKYNENPYTFSYIYCAKYDGLNAQLSIGFQPEIDCEIHIRAGYAHEYLNC
jgi:hypothetical protein